MWDAEVSKKWWELPCKVRMFVEQNVLFCCFNIKRFINHRLDLGFLEGPKPQHYVVTCMTTSVCMEEPERCVSVHACASSALSASTERKWKKRTERMMSALSSELIRCCTAPKTGELRFQFPFLDLLAIASVLDPCYNNTDQRDQHW